MSTGLRGVVRDALGWIAAAMVLALSVIHFDEIRAFNRQMFGIELPPIELPGKQPVAARAQPPPRETTLAARVGGTAEIEAGAHGHFNTEARINGRYIPLMVDTGASLVVLTYEDAMRAGVHVRDSDFTARSQTANGIARNAQVTLDRVCVESVCVNGVTAMVAEPGRLHVSLLGMSYLGRLRRVDIRSGRLMLEE